MGTLPGESELGPTYCDKSPSDPAWHSLPKATSRSTSWGKMGSDGDWRNQWDNPQRQESEEALRRWVCSCRSLPGGAGRCTRRSTRCCGILAPSISQMHRRRQSGTGSGKPACSASPAGSEGSIRICDNKILSQLKGHCMSRLGANRSTI